MTKPAPPAWIARLPFYYGWLVVAVAFVTMAIAVTARSAFSLLFPPLIEEFGWDRAVIAGAFSFGFFLSALASPFVGRLMDAKGPRFVVGTGTLLLGLGLMTAPWLTRPIELYVTLGVLLICGAGLTTYTAHSLFLPNWFVRRRALAISIAFSGAGVGAIALLPWLQEIITGRGWRAACYVLAVIVLAVIGPLTLLLRLRPEDVGLVPDGRALQAEDRTAAATGTMKDLPIVETWTLSRAAATRAFWWIALAYFCGMVAWYVVQVHQTRYLTEIGFSAQEAAWALGLVAAIAIPGQILLGALADRIGRHWVWSIACTGFAICYAALIGLESGPSRALLYVMVVSQGLLGYAATSVMGPIVKETFDGPHYGVIFGALTLALSSGGAVGPWVAGVIHDASGSYRLAFAVTLACCVVSALAIWLARPAHRRECSAPNGFSAGRQMVFPDRSRRRRRAGDFYPRLIGR